MFQFLVYRLLFVVHSKIAALSLSSVLYFLRHFSFVILHFTIVINPAFTYLSPLGYFIPFHSVPFR